MITKMEGMYEHEFPLPTVLVLLVYILILLIDKVLIDSHDVHRDTNGILSF